MRILYALLAACIITSSAYAEHGCPNLSLELEYLYWKPCYDGIYIAIEETPIENDFSFGGGLIPLLVYVDTLSLKDKIHYPKNNRESGFRIGLHYQPDCTCWDLRANYLNYHPTHTKVLSSQTPNLIPFTSGVLLDTIPFQVILEDEFATIATQRSERADRIKSTWDLQMQSIDVELGQSYCWLSCLSLRPFLGLRFAKIDQQVRIKSEGVIQSFLGDYSTLDYAYEIVNTAQFQHTERIKNTFTGIGALAGLTMECELGCGIGVFGQGATSMIYGEKEHRIKAKGSRSEDIIEAIDSDLFHEKHRSDKWCLRPISDLQIGLYWQGCFCEGRYQSKIKVGWEYRDLPNQGLNDHDVNRTYAPHDDQHLSTQGITVSASMSF